MNLDHVILINKTECPVIRTTPKSIYIWHYGQRAILRQDRLVTRNIITGKTQVERVEV